MNPEVVGKEAYFVMKKCYIVRLENQNHDIAFHVRMKGIPTQVIVNKANELFDGTRCFVDGGLVKPIANQSPFTIMQLYQSLYDGNTIEFDLVNGDRPCFDIHFGSIRTRESFVRRVGCTEDENETDSQS